MHNTSRSAQPLCLLLTILLLPTWRTAFAQSMGINSNGAAPHPSAALDVSASDKGLLIPRMALSAANSASLVSSPATSLLVYNTATAGTPPNNVAPGYYYWNGSQWILLLNSAGSGSASGWSLTGNAGTNPASNFIGTTDDQPLVLKANGQRVGFFSSTDNLSTFLGYRAGISNIGNYNTAIGESALFNNTGGGFNVAIGSGVLYSNTSGILNSAVGKDALFSNTTGESNSAVGKDALFSNTSGILNSAVGTYTLNSNTTGSNNSAVGVTALGSNTTGNYNSAVGDYALYFNTTGSLNSALGHRALFNNTTASSNSAFGNSALYSNTSGYWNVAAGSDALSNNTTGTSNTALGVFSLRINQIGSENTAVGSNALRNTTSYYNVGVGNSTLYDNTTGESNTAIGYRVLNKNTTASSNVAIGQYALAANVSGEGSTAVGTDALSKNRTGGNTALGSAALYNNVGGGWNAAVGYRALFNTSSGNGNTAVGYESLLSNSVGNNNTSIGYAAGPAQNNFSNTGAFGYSATPTASNQIRIGNSSVTSIGGQVGWSNFSDQRFKVDVQENVSGLDFILKLRPVTYRWNLGSLNRFIYGPAADTLFANSEAVAGIARQESITYTGFLAQEVEAAAQAVGYDFSGVVAPANERSPYSIRYAEFVVPLVKAVQEQQNQLTQQSQLMAGLSARFERSVVRLASADE